MIKFIIWRKGATSGLRIWRRHCYGKGSTPGAHAKGTAKKKKREPHSLQRKCWPELVQPMGKCQPRIRYLLGPSKSLLWFLFFSCKSSWFWPQVNLGKGLSNLPAQDESLTLLYFFPPRPLASLQRVAFSSSPLCQALFFPFLYLSVMLIIIIITIISKNCKWTEAHCNKFGKERQ